VKLLSFSDQELHTWKQEECVDEELLCLIVLLSSTKANMAELERQAIVHKEHVKKIFVNQERLRCNIQSLEKVASNNLVTRYLADLDKEEDDLIATNRLIDAAEEQMAQAT
jgi:hypothetical protein